MQWTLGLASQCIIDQALNQYSLAAWFKMGIAQCLAGQLETGCQPALGGWFIVDFWYIGRWVYTGTNLLESMTS